MRKSPRNKERGDKNSAPTPQKPARPEATPGPSQQGLEGVQPGQEDVLRVFQTKDQTRTFYNGISRFYDLLANRTEAPMRQVGLKLLDVQGGERVLEIGFGTGHSLVALASSAGPKGEVFGVDLSDQMLERARSNVAQSGFSNRVWLQTGDATKLTYQDDTMDAIFMSFVLELFDNPSIPTVLTECHRVLRPGGRLVVLGMSKGEGRNWVVRAFEWAHRAFPRLIDCRPIHVKAGIAQAGFIIVESCSMRRWIPVEVVLGIKEGILGADLPGNSRSGSR